MSVSAQSPSQEKVLPDVLPEHFFASGPITGYHWEQPNALFLIPCLQ